MSDKIEAVKKDFRNLLYVIWQYQNLPEPAPVQYQVAEYLQYGPNRCMIQATRGLGKTFISCAYACWWLLNHPNDEVLIVSATGPKAQDFSQLIHRWIHSVPVLAPLIPSGKNKAGARTGTTKFDVGCRTRPSHSASLSSYGITGQITGGRAHLIIGDDIETPDNSGTVDQRHKIREKVKEFDSILHPGGRIVFLGTPHGYHSIYNELRSVFLLRKWPARLPDPDSHGEMEGLAPELKTLVFSESHKTNKGGEFCGTPTFPERFNEEDLKERELAMGKSTFALQYMLNTQLADEEVFPLKIKDIPVVPLNSDKGPMGITWASGKQNARTDIPCQAIGRDQWYSPMAIDDEYQPYVESILQIDPSGRGSDETTAYVGKLLNGNIFIIEGASYAGGYDSGTLRAISELAKKHKVTQIRVEPNFGDGMFTELLRPVVVECFKGAVDAQLREIRTPLVIDSDRAKGQKEIRIIQTLEPLFNQHRVIFDEAVARIEPLSYQITHLTKDRGCLPHDDHVDCLAQLCAYFLGKISIVQTAWREKQHEQDMLKILKDWDKNARLLFSLPHKPKGGFGLEWPNATRGSHRRSKGLLS